ncbi:MAG: hypothetical protein IPJ40_16900 [Saprospirales bacterium]|nr:hypothetical protein [Saprospirales bacterium]
MVLPPPDDSLNFDCKKRSGGITATSIYAKTGRFLSTGKPISTASQTPPGQYVAEKDRRLRFSGTTMLNHWITAGDIQPRQVQARPCCRATKCGCFTILGDDFFGGKHLQVNFPSISRKGRRSFVSGTRLYITDKKRSPDSTKPGSQSGTQPNTSGAEVPDPQTTSPFSQTPPRWLAIDGNLIDYQLEIFVPGFPACSSAFHRPGESPDRATFPMGCFIRFLDKTTRDKLGGEGG